MATAPRDGTPILVRVDGPDGLGWMTHELPYRLFFAKGRWCYERSSGPVFAWHQPRSWRPCDTD